MRSLFVEDSVDMGRELETAVGSDAAAEIRNAVEGRYVCPFCGAVREQAEGTCPRCTMESTAATRQATKSRIGPWYVLQTRNPAAPGMKFETLLTFVRKGRVKARSIVRGPTTHQLWRFAAHVKGLSREFGVCYSCGEGIEPTANICPHCNRLQEPPVNPDVFLESQQESDARGNGSQPVYREIGATPLVAEDIVAPPDGAHAKVDPADPKPLPAGAKAPPKKGADGFLTAADLAAAFKLDFQEPKGRRHSTKTQVAPIAMSRENPGAAPRRKRRGFRTVLLLLLLGAVGPFAYQYHKDPAFKTQADHWYAVGLDWSKQKWAQIQQQMNKPAQPAVSKNAKGTPLFIGTGSIDGSKNTAAQPQTTEPSAKPSPWDQLYGQPATSDNRGASTQANAKPEPQSEPAPTASVKVEEPTPGTGSVTIEPPRPAARDGGLDDVRTLYRAAIDAEAQGDYSTAVKKYEQIKEYSKDLWPRDLDLRLKLAREQMR
jgi:hypothetical protein